MARGGLMMTVALATLVGCRMRDTAEPLRTDSTHLRIVQRGVIEPVLDSETDSTPLPVRPTEYSELTAAECRRQAIQNAPLADDLDSHPGNSAQLPPLFSHGRSETARLVRGYAADEIRNRAAAEALEEYYKLAVAEARFDLAAAGHAILLKQRDAAEKAIREGLKDRGDVNAIRRQILEIEAQAATLDGAIVALNASLTNRLGIRAVAPMPFWPSEPLRVPSNSADPEPNLATLQLRPDLNLLRALLCDEKGGGSLANAVLSGVNPLLADVPPPHPIALLISLVRKDDAGSRRRIQSALLSRERQAEAEVRAAVAMRRGARAATLARAAEVRNLEERVAQWEKREAAGQQVMLELAASRMELLKARGEFVQAVAEWHITDVKLRQSTGMLVREP